jgi:hypothetical protein
VRVNGHRYSPLLVVAFGTASLLACAAMGAAVAGYLFDQITGRNQP